MVQRAQKAIRPSWIWLFGFLGLFLWTGCEEPASQNPVATQETAQIQHSSDRSLIHLYFSSGEGAFLMSEERSVASASPDVLGAWIVKALLEGPKKTLERTVPEGTVLRGFYILPNRTAYVDLSREVREKHPGGAKAELMTLYSITNSLVLNIPEIESVKILVEGKEQETLTGHVDLRFPLRANLLAVR